MPPKRKRNKESLRKLKESGKVWEMEATMEFPFVAALPKAERTEHQKLREHLADIKNIIQQRGMIMPARFAASLLGVSRQRVHELIHDHTLEVVDFDGRSYVTESSVVAFAQSERKAGRPLKTPKTDAELWRLSKEYAGMK